MLPTVSFGSAAFLWPALVTAEAGRLTALLAESMAGLMTPAEDGGLETRSRWTTRNRVALDLPSMRLRDFSKGTGGISTLICAPFALHRSTIADFAHRHSLIETLLTAGIHRLHLTDWRSATPEMRFLSIDSLLAELNVAIDHLGGKVDLVGICQGGWMGLLYAARFPGKVRKLVIAGAPVDLSAGASSISAAAKGVSLSVFADLVRLGGGRLLGQRMLDLWGARDHDAAGIRQILQLPTGEPARSASAREAQFRAWSTATVDLPGTYYLQVVEWLFKENRLAAGRFVALGQRVDLSEVRQPTFLLAARNDEVVAPAQVLNTTRLIGTRDRDIRQALVPGSHLALFMGRTTLSETWPVIADWLHSDASRDRAPRASRGSASPAGT